MGFFNTHCHSNIVKKNVSICDLGIKFSHEGRFSRQQTEADTADEELTIWCDDDALFLSQMIFRMAYLVFWKKKKWHLGQCISLFLLTVFV